jgi:hypothetical protein
LPARFDRVAVQKAFDAGGTDRQAWDSRRNLVRDRLEVDKKK